MIVSIIWFHLTNHIKIFIRLCSVVNSNFLGCSSNKSFINILFLLDNLIPFPDIFSIFILCSSKYFKSFLIVLSEQDNLSEKYLTGLKSLSSIKYSRSFFVYIVILSYQAPPILFLVL